VPPDSPRRRPPDVRREQILDAAQHVILTRGLRATTVADVAEAASLAKGTVYLYFRSKDEVLAAVRARYLEQYGEALGANTGGDARTRIRELVVALYDFADKHHELHHVLFHEAGFSEADAFAAVRDRLTVLLREGAEAGELTVSDITLTASFLLHGVHGALVDAIHGGRRHARRRTATQVADLVDRTLGGATTPARRSR
jgi:AcrR family transcriptional regulator